MVVYRDAKNGSKKRVPYMWFSPKAIADGTAKDIPKDAIKCEGDVKVVSIHPYVIDADTAHVDIRYVCETCQAPYFPELPETLEELVEFVQEMIDEKY